MSKYLYVLDASALLAALLGEPGSDLVDAILADSAISAVNLSELVAKLNERGVPDNDVAVSLAELDLTVIPFDRQQAEMAGRLRLSTRTAGLSLGDRCCLALASTLGARAVTADRAWATLNIDIPIDVLR